jgi:c-di-GMP-specific phosphodiesterase
MHEPMVKRAIHAKGDAMTASAPRASDLEDGLQAGAFEPVFQPVVRLADGALAGFEALARWRQADDTLAHPALFLEAALEHDLLGAISRAILRAATASFARWRSDGGDADADNVFISVNIAGRDLERGAVLADVREALARANLPAHALRIEVTEHQVLADPFAAAAVLKALRAMGVKVLLDDFGAGYSSLHWLMHLPADALKFDALLVRGVAEDGRETKILRAMTALAHDLGLATIAEGVETTAQRDALAALRCDFAQGFLYARGLTEADAAAYLRAHR